MSHSPRGAASDKTRPRLKQARPRVVEKALAFAQTGFGSGRFGGQAFALASQSLLRCHSHADTRVLDLRCTGLVQQTPSRSDVVCAVMCLSKIAIRACVSILSRSEGSKFPSLRLLEVELMELPHPLWGAS
jgi:hypothetical protein